MAQEQAKSPAALVTAGARRIGKVLALKLAELGHEIALHYCNSRQEAEATASEIEELGRRCRIYQSDFNKSESLQNLLPSVIADFPELQVLVNNASTWQAGKFCNSSLDELSSYLRVHLEAPYILTRDFARLAAKGNVVNILDSNIVKHKSDNFAYLLSKKALYDLTLMAAAELAPAIRVNGIAPGAVLAPEDERKNKYMEKFDKNPLERCGSPDDVAGCLEFLLQSRHISGQVIFSSGGKQLLF